ncbi:hypothetical protein D3C84_976070 [compost metagenome]
MQPLATTGAEGVGQAFPYFVVTFIQSGFDQAPTGFKVHASNVFSTADRLIVYFAMPLANVGVYLGHPGKTFLFTQRQMLRATEFFERQTWERIGGDSQVGKQSLCL